MKFLILVGGLTLVGIAAAGIYHIITRVTLRSPGTTTNHHTEESE